MKQKLHHFILCLLIGSTVQAQVSFKTIENISYKQGDAYVNERCHLDIRFPEMQGLYPVVIWFHGGGLTAGEAYFPDALKEKEMVLVAVNYRLYPEVDVSVCIEDAAAAIAWTFKNIEKYKGDTENIIIAGHSAGGYLTLMTGMDKKWLAAHDIDANDIRALFPFSGHTITHFTERRSRDIPGTQPIIDDMAPLFHVRADAPPLFLMTGDRELELLGRYEENAYMWRMMSVVGHQDCFLFEFDGHDHGAMVNPGCYVLLEYLETLE